MQRDTESIKNEIEALEAEMAGGDFWADKARAQSVIKMVGDLKEMLLGAKKYDKGNAILSIMSGAGGDDAEDFSAMLLRMYMKYIERKGWSFVIIHENKNEQSGYRNVSIEVIKTHSTSSGLGPYGVLKNESGVHRLVRLSPFNAKAKRNTSFSLVEVIPKFENNTSPIEIPPDELKIEFSKAGGPGGQNVNKRETAVRIIHLPTNMAVHVATERSQEQNRERAMKMLEGKLFKKREEDDRRIANGLSISKTTDIEWGSQIRNYVLHPYKLVKDLRTGVETTNADGILEDGELDLFIEAEADL